jgi:hypothetical protein
MKHVKPVTTAKRMPRKAQEAWVFVAIGLFIDLFFLDSKS